MSSFNENGIVDLLKRRFGGHGRFLEKGIGDDAAVLRPPGDRKRWVVTTDMLVEEVDFCRAWQTPAQLGWKSLAVNLSDIAAMGARPRFHTVSLALPAELGTRWLMSFYEGLDTAGKTFASALIGGDLSRSPGGIQISITALGQSRRRRLVYRSGGSPGDWVCVAGVLGRAAAGLDLLQKGRKRGKSAAERRAIDAFLKPWPCCEAGQYLAQCGRATAMMDLSDGLSADLPRLCRASGAGAEIYYSKLPLFCDSRAWDCDPLNLALHGGEDFALLFCVRPRQLQRLQTRWPKRFPSLTPIGRLVPGRGVVCRENAGMTARPLPQLGFDHFRSPEARRSKSSPKR